VEGSSALGNSALAGYFTATSTTATSTFAGGLAVETSGLVYDYSTNNVGIGTTGPQSELDIRGTYTAENGGLSQPIVNIISTNAAATDTGGTLQFGGETGQPTSPYGFASIKGAKSSAGTYGGYLSFFTVTTGSTLTERMRIEASGNVGIGQTAPATPLSLAQDTGILSWGNNDGSTQRASILGTSANTLTFSILNSEKMVINSSGNVGIGTTAPVFLMDILSGTGNTGANINNPSQLSVTGANKTLTGGGATVFVNSNSAMAADTGGQIVFTGRDTTSSTNSIQWGVIKGAKANGTSANQDGYVAIAVNTHNAGLVEGMRLTANGAVVNVGIGTTNPAAKLHIGGDNARQLSIDKSTVAVTAPGAGVGMLRWEAGTNAGTLKLVAYAGTSTTGTTVVDNVGAGN